MHNKDRHIVELHNEIIKRFGPDAFSATGSERLGSNHAVYSRQPDGRIEISVVAGGEGQAPDRYSVQVEFDIREPDFEIPLIKENLSLEEVLMVFTEYRNYA
jgi:hypothetical protein